MPDDEQPPQKKIKKRTHRCTICRKKIHSLYLVTHTCRCGQLFCDSHMHDHSCTYDYTENGKKVIEAQNPHVQFDKIQKL